MRSESEVSANVLLRNPVLTSDSLSSLYIMVGTGYRWWVRCQILTNPKTLIWCCVGSYLQAPYHTDIVPI